MSETTTNRPTIAERVARGIALLDRSVRDWRTWINRKRLDIGTCGNCIIGQLFADEGFSKGATLLGMRDDDLYTHGFEAKYGPGITCEAIDDEYQELTAEWLRVMRANPIASE